MVAHIRYNNIIIRLCEYVEILIHFQGNIYMRNWIVDDSMFPPFPSGSYGLRVFYFTKQPGAIDVLIGNYSAYFKFKPKVYQYSSSGRLVF